MTAEPPTMPDRNDPVGASPGSVRPGQRGVRLRYSVKVARRELRRRPWRAALVVMLVALPTWVMLNLAIQMRTGIAADNHPAVDFSSDLIVPFKDPGPTDPRTTAIADRALVYGSSTATKLTAAEVEEGLPVGSTTQRVIGGYTSIMASDGAIRSATFMKIDLGTNAAATWAPISEGRPPEAGEVVLGEQLAADLGVGVGDTLTLRQPEGRWTVSGIAGRFADWDLVAVRDFDDSLFASTSGVLLVNLPAGTDANTVQQLQDDLGAYAPMASRFAVEYESTSDEAAAVAITWLAATMLFIMFGVIIVAAFATIARGQLVTVGQLAANGATRGFTRGVMASQGLWAGVVGVAVGGLATLATLPLLKPIILGGLWAPVPLSWSPLDVIAIAIIGVGVAAAAAVLPAYSLVKTSVLDALAGRRAERPVPRWMVPVGVVAFGLGLLVLVVSSTSSSGVGIAGAMLGVLAMVIGISLVGPLVIDLASRTASVMPISISISLRGLGRSRLRSAAVVSSIAVTTGVMAVIVAGLETDAGGPLPGEYADNVALVAAYPSVEMRTPGGDALLDALGSPVTDPESVEAVEIRWAASDNSASADQVRRVLPDAIEHPLRVAVLPDGTYDNSEGQLLRSPTSEEGDELAPTDALVVTGAEPIQALQSLPLIADESTLTALNLPESFRRDIAVAGVAEAVTASDCGPDGEVTGTWDGKPVEAAPDAAASFDPLTHALIRVPGIECYRWVGPFMTEQFAVDHGFQIEPAGTVFENPEPISAEQREQLTSHTNPSMFVNWDYEGAAGLDPVAAVDSSVVTSSYQAVSQGVSVYWPTYTEDSFNVIQLTVFGVAAVFVALIAGIGLALAATDSRRDRAVLSVIGARPATRRRVAATDAGVQVVIGTLMGVPPALLAAHIVTKVTNQDTPTGVPWLFVAAEFVAIPLFVAGCAYVAGLFRRTSLPMRVLQVD